MSELRSVIVGTKHKGADALRALGALAKGDPVEFRAEPENQFDPGAVAIYTGSQHLGYLPRHSNRDVRRALDRGHAVTGEVTLAAVMDDSGQVARGGLPHVVARWGEAPAQESAASDPAPFNDSIPL